MGKTKSQASWIRSYPWVKPLKKSENHAYCSMCSSGINVSAGATQLQLAQKKQKNTKMLLLMTLPDNPNLSLIRMVKLP